VWDKLGGGEEDRKWGKLGRLKWELELGGVKS
jgi:hypothetical protein